MARRSKVRVSDPVPDLATQVAILEREMAVQREALQRLKDMARAPRADREPPASRPLRQTA